MRRLGLFRDLWVIFRVSKSPELPLCSSDGVIITRRVREVERLTKGAFMSY